MRVGEGKGGSKWVKNMPEYLVVKEKRLKGGKSKVRGGGIIEDRERCPEESKPRIGNQNLVGGKTKQIKVHQSIRGS